MLGALVAGRASRPGRDIKGARAASRFRATTMATTNPVMVATVRTPSHSHHLERVRALKANPIGRGFRGSPLRRLASTTTPAPSSPPPPPACTPSASSWTTAAPWWPAGSKPQRLGEGAKRLDCALASATSFGWARPCRLRTWAQLPSPRPSCSAG